MRDWEEMYRQGDIPWDKGAPAPPLQEWLDANSGRMDGSVLVPGCGLGHDVRLLARVGSASVTGLDFSATAVRMAREIPPAGGEDYLEADLFSFARENSGRYHWIWEHTLYCAIDPDERDRYVQAAWELLRPGGTLLALFYLDPYDDDHAPGGGPPHGCSEEELRSRFVESGMFEWLRDRVPGRAYPGREERELLVELRRKE